jgi:hypothetical protein
MTKRAVQNGKRIDQDAKKNGSGWRKERFGMTSKYLRGEE